MSALLLLLHFIPFTWGESKEFFEESEKDFSLRSIGQLEVKNFKGNLQVQGWPLDKIRIKLKKSVKAGSPEVAKELLTRISYRLVSRNARDEEIEISNQYSEQLSIKDRLKENEHPTVRMDLIVFAPSRIKLDAWVANGQLTLKNWNAPVTIRSNQGTVLGEDITADTTSVFCSACAISLKNIKGSVHCVGGEGKISLEGVAGSQIYSEVREGSLSLVRIQGDQLYVANRGDISGNSLEGNIQFQSRQAAVDLKNISGHVSGTSEKGNISLAIQKWTPLGQSLVESIDGSISLTLPWRVSANVDIWSPNGKTNVDFPITGTTREQILDQNSSKRWVGRLRDGGELIKIFTKTGNIKVFRSSF